MSWFLYTDGSAICDESLPGHLERPRRFPGGWAAVVEHGSEGFVLRGRAERTTNTRMELVAVIEGLRAVPAGERVQLHYDCTVVTVVHQRWEEGRFRTPAQVEATRLLADGDLWLELVVEFARVDAELRLLGRGSPHPIHARAHGIAQTEAKAARAGLPVNATVLARVEKKERRQAAMVEQARRDDLRRRQQVDGFGAGRVAEALARAGLRHTPDCEFGFCVDHCPVGDRRASWPQAS